MIRAYLCYCVLGVAAAALALGGCSGSTAVDPPQGKSAAEWISEGDKRLADHQWDDALAAFDSAVDSDSDSAEARERRGLAYLRLGKLDKAVDDCSAALKVNGKLTDAYFVRGQAEQRLGTSEKAAADFSAALDTDPDRAEILTARAALYQQMAAAATDREQARKWLDLALKDFEKALKARPRDAASLVRRAEIYLDTGDYPPAIDDCDKALEIDPRMAAARVARARGLIEKGEFEKAIADCTAAIAADGARLDAYAVRAEARVERSSEVHTVVAVADCDKAVDDCAKALSLSGKVKGDADALRRAKRWLAVVHDLCGTLYESARAGTKAFDEYSAAISMDPGLAEALIHRAMNRARAKDYPAAMADCNQAIEIDRTRPEGYYGRGMIYGLQGEFAEAVNELNEAVARKYPKAYSGLTLIYFYLTRTELVKARTVKDQADRAATDEKLRSYRQKCIECATKALEANCDSLRSRLLRGLAYADNHNFEKAYDDLSTVIRDDPLAAKAYFYRGVLRLMAHQPKASINDFSKTIELQPDYAAAYKNRGDAFWATDDPISAKADFMKYQELMKRFKDEKKKELDRPEDLFGKSEQQSATNLGPAFQPLVDGWKAIEKKLDGMLRK